MLMNQSELKDRVKQFAHRCIKLALSLPDSPLGRHVRSQLIKCSSSAAANYRAVCLAQSRAHFASKLSIVVEETDECVFWLEFTVDERLMPESKVRPLIDDGMELAAIFIASRKTVKNRKKEFVVARINNQ